jgi:hypothetical protein
MAFACEEFQVFHFGVIIKLFSFLSCSSSFFFHFIALFFQKLLYTLKSYGVKASEHE